MRPQTPLYRTGRKMKKFVMNLCIRVSIRRSIVVCLALVTVCALLLLTTMNVQASTVTINDQAGVLDTGRVQADAAQLSEPMLIYTTKTFTGDQDALNSSTREQLSDQNAIAIGIDTVHRHLSIQAGTKVQLSDSQASDAVSAFQSNYNGGDYTGATIAAIDSLRNTLSGGSGFNILWQVLGVIAIMLGVSVVFWVLNARTLRRRVGNDGPSRSLVYWLTIARPWNTTYTSSNGVIYRTNTPSSGNSSGNYGGGAGGSYGGGSSGGGAGGSF
jgi:uncharacterized membrane protein YgcG